MPEELCESPKINLERVSIWTKKKTEKKSIPQDVYSTQIHEPESLSTFKCTLKNI